MASVLYKLVEMALFKTNFRINRVHVGYLNTKSQRNFLLRAIKSRDLCFL